MRLLNINTLKLEEFFNRLIPPYAILSHTWGDAEETYQDFQRSPQFRPRPPKIIGCCEQAKNYGLAYVWIDTICIDKGSSAELSEAINSMFAWYRRSYLCFAYLADVNFTAVEHFPDKGDTVALNPAVRDAIKCSRWFTRGWTLQELMAPSNVLFFSNTWSFIGRRDDAAEIAPLINIITRIPSTLLVQGIEDDVLHEGYSVAIKMSWAAGRQTTRVEDEAYCLLGLFGVNMALLYGEGEKAFIRLQEEIIRRSTDESIFTARCGLRFDAAGSAIARTTALATSTCAFRYCSRVVECAWEDQLFEGQDSFDVPARHSMLTNNGILLTLPILETRDPLAADDNQYGFEKSYTAIIRCYEVCTLGMAGQQAIPRTESTTDHRVDNIFLLPVQRLHQNQLRPNFGSPATPMPIRGLTRAWKNYTVYLQGAQSGASDTVCRVSLRGFPSTSLPRLAAIYPSIYQVTTREGDPSVFFLKMDRGFGIRRLSVFLHYTSTHCKCSPSGVCPCGCRGTWPDFAIRIEFATTGGFGLDRLRDISAGSSCSILTLKSRAELFDMLITAAAVKHLARGGLAERLRPRDVSALADTTARWAATAEWGRYTCIPSVQRIPAGLMEPLIVDIDLGQRVEQEAGVTAGQSDVDYPWFRDLADLKNSIHSSNGH